MFVTDWESMLHTVIVSTYFRLDKMLNLGNGRLYLDEGFSRNSLSANFPHLSGVYFRGAPILSVF